MICIYTVCMCVCECVFLFMCVCVCVCVLLCVLGKSSLFQSILRLVDSASGSISIDNIDISSIGLFDLRSRMSIIPQVPVIFSGTLRYNLDPFTMASDQQ